MALRIVHRITTSKPFVTVRAAPQGSDPWVEVQMSSTEHGDVDFELEGRQSDVVRTLSTLLKVVRDAKGSP